MKILVAGRSGQVAQSLAAISTPERQFVTLGRPELDITDPASVGAAILEHKPAALINAAAYTAVDKAESEPDAAFAANETGPRVLATAAREAGIPILHISTDYVFAGNKDGFYTEDDPVDPQSVYGRSKLAGERAVAQANPDHVILRTAWVFSPYGNNFLKTMLRLAADRDVVRVVADQWGSPTYAPDIAAGLAKVLDHALASPADPTWRGIFHMTAEGTCTWADFAEEIFRQSAERGGAKARVERITTAEYPTPAKRPANSRLDNTKFASVFGLRIPPWKAAMVRMQEWV
ncbi:dTDP-4-dehydrorhamnose reductase [Tianweitania populi]|uniref:dTDP-4-dehydrorhamnose reductase n=1 Tax=Tianweitania populi TaxID=1607949 RepID=A0A8J3DWT1_9HYPH|nr:dTDP-4-dehydrorhamnose reductase [Tianweitania populi]GHD14530.1 NAD(P)-dependent oxidoreductase [Tianweitania populi]